MNAENPELISKAAIMLKVRQLLATNPIAFYEFVSLCRDRDHSMWGDTSRSARNFGLIEDDGRVHQLIREAVAEHVVVDGLEMRIA